MVGQSAVRSRDDAEDDIEDGESDQAGEDGVQSRIPGKRRQACGNAFQGISSFI